MNFVDVINNYRDAASQVNIRMNLTELTDKGMGASIKEDWVLNFDTNRTQVLSITRNEQVFQLGPTPPGFEAGNVFYWHHWSQYKCERIRVFPSTDGLSFTGEIWKYDGPVPYVLGAVGQNVMNYTWP
jgi:hypothetical protein